MRIKEVLNEKGISVAKLAEQMGVSKQALHKQVNGKLHVETAERIAAYLDVPIWELFVSKQEIEKDLGLDGTKCPVCGHIMEKGVDY